MARALDDQSVHRHGLAGTHVKQVASPHFVPRAETDPGQFTDHPALDRDGGKGMDITDPGDQHGHVLGHHIRDPHRHRRVGEGAATWPRGGRIGRAGGGRAAAAG